MSSGPYFALSKSITRLRNHLFDLLILMFKRVLERVRIILVKQQICFGDLESHVLNRFLLQMVISDFFYFLFGNIAMISSIKLPLQGNSLSTELGFFHVLRAYLL